MNSADIEAEGRARVENRRRGGVFAAGRIPVLVGFDPSLRATAFAAVTLDGNLTPVAVGACPTNPSTKRGDYFLLRQLDDAKRARRVYRWTVEAICSIPVAYCVRAVAMESPSGIPTSFVRQKPGAPPRPKGWRPPQDAQAFGKMVRGGQAVFDALDECFDGDPVFVSTYGAKEAATGSARPKGGKKEVEQSIKRLFAREELERLLATVQGGATGREGVYDAFAVVLGALGSVPVRAAIEDYRRATGAAEAPGGPQT